MITLGNQADFSNALIFFRNNTPHHFKVEHVERVFTKTEYSWVVYYSSSIFDPTEENYKSATTLFLQSLGSVYDLKTLSIVQKFTSSGAIRHWRAEYIE